MTRCFIKSLLFLTFILSFSLLAGAEETALVVTALQTKYQNTTAWSAGFSQETFVELLGRKVKKRGKIAVKKPGKLRIEYLEEGGKTYISNGKTLWVAYSGDDQVEVFKNPSQVVAREALTFLKGLGDIEKEFLVGPVAKTELSETMMTAKNLRLLKLKPRTGGSLIRSIVLGVDPKTSLVKEMTLFNESGNRTHYVFDNIQLNASMSDTLFEFTAGAKK